MVFLDESFDASYVGNIEGLFLGSSIWSTDGEVIGYDEGIKMGSTDGNFLALHSGMYMESHMGYMLEQRCTLLMVPLLVIMFLILRGFYFETH